MYVLVRRDLSFAQQVVQSCHAVAEAARTLLPSGLDHPHIIVCSVADESALYRALDRLRAHNIRSQAFFEPDLGGQMTALATEPVFGAARRVFRRYRLLGDLVEISE